MTGPLAALCVSECRSLVGSLSSRLSVYPSVHLSFWLSICLSHSRQVGMYYPVSLFLSSAPFWTLLPRMHLPHMCMNVNNRKLYPSLCHLLCSLCRITASDGPACAGRKIPAYVISHTDTCPPACITFLLCVTCHGLRLCDMSRS